MLAVRQPEAVAASLVSHDQLPLDRALLLWLSQTLEAERATCRRQRCRSQRHRLNCWATGPARAQSASGQAKAGGGQGGRANPVALGQNYAFRLLNYGLSLRGLEALPAPYQLVESGSAEPPLISVLIPVQNH